MGCSNDSTIVGTIVDGTKRTKYDLKAVNMIKKHTKANPQAGVAGGIIEKEAPIRISNVAIFTASSSKADRVGYRVEDGKKVRIYKSSGELIDA